MVVSRRETGHFLVLRPTEVACNCLHNAKDLLKILRKCFSRFVRFVDGNGDSVSEGGAIDGLRSCRCGSLVDFLTGSLTGEHWGVC